MSFILIFLFSFSILNAQIPDDYQTVTKPASYQQIVALLDELKQNEHITVTEIGQSVEGRNLFLVSFAARSKTSKPWKIFLYGQQHGNEHAGKDALLYLCKKIVENPQWLPDDVELHIIPQVNPDGGERDQRRNANDFDLNRDHKLLSQPETQSLHKTFREIMPHIAVDCHEFGRDSHDYLDFGWEEWPIIMMDTANNPLFSQAVFKFGVLRCEQAIEPMTRQGHNYCRYYVGGVPPDEEQRHSTPEIDDARNGFGAYGGLSFIIESGIKRNAANPQADLGKRIAAYLSLFEELIKNNNHRALERKAIEQARTNPAMDFIPVNYFWANATHKVSKVKVINKSQNKVQEIATANFMKDLVVKKYVSFPKQYIIPAQDAQPFKNLLIRHKIEFTTVDTMLTIKTQSCRLEEIQDFSDNVYNRYAGRHIVTALPDSLISFTSGSLIIDLQNKDRLRSAALLEPHMLYGLYKEETFKKNISKNKIIPVYRVLNP